MIKGTLMKTVAIYIAPQFSLFHFATPKMVFSTKLDGERLFEVKTVAEQKIIALMDGISIKADGDLSLFEEADIIIIPAWHQVDEPPSVALTHALQQANQRHAMVVGLCLGAYPLAYSGLLDGKKAATHWQAEQDFSERFSQIQLDLNALYVQQNNVITSAGTVAGLDCCLAIIRELYGVKIANRLARLFVTPPHREGGQAQYIEQPLPRKTPNENINELLDEIRANLQADYAINQLAKRFLMSRSTFTRHFRKATGLSFRQWLIETRLQKARELLEDSSLSIEQINQQVGFQSTTNFRQHFLAKHHITPTAYRKAFST